MLDIINHMGFLLRLKTVITNDIMYLLKIWTFSGDVNWATPCCQSKTFS